MQDPNLNGPRESTDRGLDQRHTAEVALPVEQLVDELSKACAPLARVSWLLLRGSREMTRLCS